jgi:hypothetical protein
VAGSNPVDGHDGPVPHVGLVLGVERFQELAQRLTDVGPDFVIEPYVRVQGEPGVQRTMSFGDPSGSALEFEAFRDLAQLFAVRRPGVRGPGVMRFAGADRDESVRIGLPRRYRVSPGTDGHRCPVRIAVPDVSDARTGER